MNADTPRIISRESLYQLFLHGPTYDGDVISKSQRDELVRLKLCDRREGYNFLTREGVEVALSMHMDRDKTVRQRQDRTKLADYGRVVETIKKNLPYREKVEVIVGILL